MSIAPFGAWLDDVAVQYRSAWRMTEQATVMRETGGIALDGATCVFPAGAITGLLGRNGAGKTSLLGGGVLAVAAAAFGVDRFYRDMPLRPALS